MSNTDHRKRLPAGPGKLWKTNSPAMHALHERPQVSPWDSLRCQFGTLKRGGHSKYLPFAFTEQGVAMLSGVLSSKRAVHVNILIMRTFIKLRQMLLDNADLRKELKELKQITENRFQIVFETLDQLLVIESKPRKKIGFIIKEKQRSYGRLKP
jgi:hypothetical protein